MSCLMTKPTKWHPPSLISLSCPHNQSGRLPRLIWVFAGCTAILLVLSWVDSNHLSWWLSSIRLKYVSLKRVTLNCGWLFVYLFLNQYAPTMLGNFIFKTYCNKLTHGTQLSGSMKVTCSTVNKKCMAWSWVGQKLLITVILCALIIHIAFLWKALNILAFRG